MIFLHCFKCLAPLVCIRGTVQLKKTVEKQVWAKVYFDCYFSWFVLLQLSCINAWLFRFFWHKCSQILKKKNSKKKKNLHQINQETVLECSLPRNFILVRICLLIKRMNMFVVCGCRRSLPVVCVSKRVCVYLSLDVLQKSVLTFSGARGRLILEHPALSSAAHGETGRERTHKLWAKEPVILVCVCVCVYGTAVCFYSSMIALGYRLFSSSCFLLRPLMRRRTGIRQT